MNQIERIYKIDQLLNDRGVVSFQSMMDALEVSRATLKRDLACLRDRLNAPIVFDREAGGYRFDHTTPQIGAAYELPGLWFSADEIHALLTMHHVLTNLDTSGLLGPHIRPLLGRLTALMGAADNPADEVIRRVRVLSVGNRPLQLDCFQSIGSALLRRKRLFIHYHARGTDCRSERELSPQRLVHYRGNWYLDAWCHLRDELRSFAIDAIGHVELRDTAADDVAEEKLNEALGSGYGIFSGKSVQWATLRFSPLRARWVASEHWHSKQKGKMLDDGSYELSLPYSNNLELIMDILKYGSDCEVLGPEALREKVKRLLTATSAMYE